MRSRPTTSRIWASLLPTALLLVLGSVGRVDAETCSRVPFPEEDETSRLLIVADAPEALGYGWDRLERSQGRLYRWMNHHEADLYVTLTEPEPAELWFHAMPLVLPPYRQRVGLFVNNHYVGSWTCSLQSTFQAFSLRVPMSSWRMGENRITLRVSYLRHQGSDPRKLGLAVEKMLWRPTREELE